MTERSSAGAPRRLVVLGAGPIGLETALAGSARGYEVRILEAAGVGANLLSWGHVRMFSPWGMNCSELGLGSLAAAGVEPYGADRLRCPTGREFTSRYLAPLARSAPLRGRIERNVRVVSVGRTGALKNELIGDPERARLPFRILVEKNRREEVREADVVIDATGTYGRPRWLGDGGIPAPGERDAVRAIEYGLVDFAGATGRRFLGKRVLLIGAGHSAATSALGLAEIVRKDPRTRVFWSFRRSTAPLYPRHPEDPLPERDRLSAAANAIASGSVGAIEALPGTVVRSIASARAPGRDRRPRRGPLVVTLSTLERTRRVTVDRIVANVGFAPDRSIYSELQVHECYATGGPMKLAAALLGGGAASDCLSRTEVSADLLSNPEPGFFILGSKSYGRSSAFLIRSGLDQIRTLFEGLESADRRPIKRPA